MSAVNAVDRLPSPPLPLTPDLRADVARRRADGRSWDAVGAALGFDPNALRRACEADGGFAAALDAAIAEAESEAELRALARLKRLTASENERVALKAAEVILKYAREQRRERAKAAPKTVETPKPVEVPKAAPTAPLVRNLASKAKPAAGAFRAVPDLSPERLAELPLG